MLELYFIGSQNEASFSMKNAIIGKRSSRRDIATYGAIMNAKSDLITKGRSSFHKYHCKNILHDPVNTLLVYHKRTTNCRYTKRLQKK